MDSTEIEKRKIIMYVILSSMKQKANSQEWDQCLNLMDLR